MLYCAVEPSAELNRLFKMLDEAAVTNLVYDYSTMSTTSRKVEATEHDANFARFQEELAAFSLSLPRSAESSGSAPQKSSPNTGVSSAESTAAVSNVPESRTMTYKTPPTEAAASASSSNSDANRKSGTVANKGIRSEYAETSNASKSGSTAMATNVSTANENDYDDDEEDLFMASRARMKSASAIASSQLQKPPSETKAVIPVISRAARAKLAEYMSKESTGTIDNGSEEEEDDDEIISGNKEEEEHQDTSEEDKHLKPVDRSSSVSPDSEADEDAVEEVSAIESVPTSTPVKTHLEIKEEESTEKYPTPAKKPLIEKIRTLSPSVGSPASDASASVNISSGSFLSGSLQGGVSRNTKQKGKVVMMNTRNRPVVATSTASAVTTAAAGSEADSPVKIESNLPVNSFTLSPTSKTGAVEGLSAVPEIAVADTVTIKHPVVVAEAARTAEAEAVPEPVTEIEVPVIQIPSTIELEPVKDASILPLFPWTCLAQKTTGMMIASQWTSTLNNKTGSSASSEVDDHSICCELQDLIVVSFNLEENSADHEVFLLFEWILRQLGDNMAFVGFLRGSMEDDKQHQHSQQPQHELYNLAVFRKNSEDVSVHYVQQVAQVTKLVDILPNRIRPISSSSSNRSTSTNQQKIYVSNAVSLLEFYDMPDRVVNHLVAAHRNQANNTLILPTGVLPSQVHIASVVFRPESLFSDGSSQYSGGHSQSAVARGALSTLTLQAEVHGLRVVGVRLVHLEQRLSQEVKRLLNVDLHLGASASLSPILIVSFVSMHGQAVADILRGIIGPEDPNLARKTDPHSIRAVFGGQNRDANVVLPLSYAKEKLLKEASYWFGPRIASAGYSMLLLPKVMTVELGLRMVQYHQPNKSTQFIWWGDDMAKIQRLVMDAVIARLEEHGHVRHMQSVSLSDFATRMFRLKPVYQYKSQEVMGELENLSGAQCLLWRLETTVSSSFLYSMWQALTADITSMLQSICKMHSDHNSSLGVTCYVTTSTTATDSSSMLSQSSSSLHGSQYLAQQILSKLSVHNYRSHEDVGLSDTIVLSIPLQSTIVGNVSLRTSTYCRFLPLLFSRLPPSTHAHLVGATTSADGSTLYVVVRGYQIIECIDDVVRDIQAQYQQLLVNQVQPFANALQSQWGTNGGASLHGSNVMAVVRGRRALEKILQLFPLNTLYIQPAVEDVRRYVPNSYQFIPDDLFTNQACLEQFEQHAQTSTVAKAVANALFPPGVFTALGVVILPIQPLPRHHTGTSHGQNAHQQHQQVMNHMLLMMRYQVATLSRLHKEDFTVLAMQATESLSGECYERLCRENFETYIEEYRMAGVSWEDAVERFHIDDMLTPSVVPDAPVSEREETEMQNELGVLPPVPPPPETVRAPKKKEKGESAADCITRDDLKNAVDESEPSAPAPAPVLPPAPVFPSKKTVATRRVIPALNQSQPKAPAALIVLVARKSALLKLRHTVGPALDDGVACEKYPRSLTALFASLFPGQIFASADCELETQGNATISRKSSPTRSQVQKSPFEDRIERYPFILTSLTCTTVDWLVKKYLPVHRDVLVSIQQESIDALTADNQAEQFQDYFRVAEEFFGIDLTLQDRLACVLSGSGSSVSTVGTNVSNVSSNGARKSNTRSVSVLLKSDVVELTSVEQKGRLETEASNTDSLMESVDSKTVDLAGVVITSALIAHHGLDTILDVIHREGLVVRSLLLLFISFAIFIYGFIANIDYLFILNDRW